MKYEIKLDKKNEKIFYLYENWNKKLISIGNEDLMIMKDKYSYCIQNENSIFDYKGIRNAIWGRTGRDSSLKVDLKRFIVFEMK